MKFEETAIDIEKVIEKFQDVKIIYRCCLLSMYYHVNLCKRNNCKCCDFIMDFNSFLLFGEPKGSEEIPKQFLQQIPKDASEKIEQGVVFPLCQILLIEKTNVPFRIKFSCRQIHLWLLLIWWVLLQRQRLNGGGNFESSHVRTNRI